MHLSPFPKVRVVIVVDLFVSHEYIMTTDAENWERMLPGWSASSVLSLPLVQVEKSELQLIFSQSEDMLIVGLGVPERLVPMPHINVQKLPPGAAVKPLVEDTEREFSPTSASEVRVGTITVNLPLPSPRFMLVTGAAEVPS